MDSISGSHKGLKNLIQSYLCEEWKERHSDAANDASSKFLLMKFISLELPQQENFFDCGLFLLHYVECFLEEAPLCPFNVTKSSNFLSRNWFLPKEASLKRQKIKKLIYKIFEDHSRNMPRSDSIDRDPSTAPSETCDQETEVVVLERISDHEVRGSLSEPRGDLCFGKSGLVSSVLSELGASSSSYSGANYQQSPASGHTTLQFKEVEDIDEKVPETPLDVYSFLDSPLPTDEQVSDSLLIVEDSIEDQSTEQHEVSGYIRKHEKRKQEIRQLKKDNVTRVISNLDKELADCVVKDSDGEGSDNDGSNVRCFLFSMRVLRKRPS